MKMKKYVLMVFYLLFCLLTYSEEIVKTTDGRQIILYDDHTWIEKTTDISDEKDIVKLYKDKLRQDIRASDSEIKTACEMLADGWKYTMPRPKSAKAAWGISDGRTTWWNGYWYNEKTQFYSTTTPIKKNSGLYLGDNQNDSNTWRNGGSPRKPDVYMFLLSDSGGPSS